jgi:hypothetical protein
MLPLNRRYINRVFGYLSRVFNLDLYYFIETKERQRRFFSFRRGELKDLGGNTTSALNGKWWRVQYRYHFICSEVNIDDDTAKYMFKVKFYFLIPTTRFMDTSTTDGRDDGF